MSCNNTLALFLSISAKSNPNTSLAVTLYPTRLEPVTPSVLAARIDAFNNLILLTYIMINFNFYIKHISP